MAVAVSATAAIRGRVIARRPARPKRPPEAYVGKLRRTEAGWILDVEPHVAMMAKRIWKRPSKKLGRLILEMKPGIHSELLWFMSRYPLEVSERDLAFLRGESQAYEAEVLQVRDYLGDYRPPPTFNLAIPPRPYQARTAAVLLTKKQFLCADQMGLGKTCVGITPMTDQRTLPAIVVTLTNLPDQWAGEVKKFMPHLHPHVIKSGDLYPLAGGKLETKDGRPPDVIITSYSKLAKWAEILAAYGNYVVFDECQELRNRDDGRGGYTQKWTAAKHIADNCEFRLGLSGTPIYNRGDEMFNVFEVLAPGVLGSWYEFATEWLTPAGNGKYNMRDPDAFGSWARHEGLMVRHTRKEVGRELPPVVSVVQEIGADAKALDDIQGRAAELARILLNPGGQRRGAALMAGGELDQIVRQATGLAKAPFVAEFVKMLVDGGEKVLLSGWHHSVYEIWEERLAAGGIEAVRYTGKENVSAKRKAFDAFIHGTAQVMIISNRAGAGLEGLQRACSVLVVGELDWSPGVLWQLVCRLHRDGQLGPLLVYYLVADSGCDPLMAEVLGVKKAQADGIIDPGGARASLFSGSDVERTRRMARDWLERQR